HPARGRARLLYSGLAGGCGALGTRRDRTPAPTRDGGLMRRALLLACAAPALMAAGDGTFSDPWRFRATDGATLYRDVCQECHMPDGQGAAGAARYPSLAHDPRLESADYAIALVLRGSGAMPPFARQLTDRQIAGI